VTVVIFGCLNRSFYLLTYLLTNKHKSSSCSLTVSNLPVRRWCNFVHMQLQHTTTLHHTA